MRYKIHGNGAEWNEAQGVEYSASGVRLLLKDQLRVGARLHVELPPAGSFQLSSSASSFHLARPFQTEGKVVWVAPSTGDPSALECGIVFLNSKHAPGRERFVSFITDRLCDLAFHCTSDMVAQPAQSLGHLHAAYRLIYKEYLKRGYCQADPSEMHYNPFCLLPGSRTFVLRRGEGPLLGTISLIVDSPCGLPMETIFPYEVAKLRAPGRRLAEVGLLALDLDAVGRKSFSLAELQKQATLFRLFKIMADYARGVGGVTDLIIGMHPKHEALYRYLNFETIGPVRTYPGACGKPALPMRLDFERAYREWGLAKGGRGAYFYGHPFPRELLERYFKWTPEAVRELLMERRPLWEDLSEQVKAHLQSCYPGLIR